MVKMKELITALNAANKAYYTENREIISNLEYDTLYDELLQLEAETGVQLANSPTRKVGYEVVSELKKAAHAIPMLSLDKTKDPQQLAEFLGTERGLLSWKLDGLAIVLTFENGTLSQAVTRGNGTVGEDVTHNARVFTNIPLTTPHKGKFTLRGEAVISISDFEQINEEESNKYKNPRNLCSGAVRQLNSQTAAKRRVLFYAYGLISAPDTNFTQKSEQLEWLTAQGFETVGYTHVTAENITQTVETYKARIPTEPLMSDGLVLTFDNITYSESLGTTSKFPKDSMAFKWADETAETTLTEIEWSTSRTGLINPIAIFTPVEIEGTIVSRASLHNVSILRALNLHVGDKISVYKANMIIPQVAENLSRTADSPTPPIPENCPVCDAKAQLIEENETETLICTNPQCAAQTLRAFSHFVSRDALNIEGLSEQTLEKLITAGMLNNYADLFSLSRHKAEILQMEGFGQKSYDNLIASIETAKTIALPNFIYALGIKHVGLSNAKLLCTHFSHDPAEIAAACQSPDYAENLTEIPGYGEAISQSLHAYFTDPQNLALYNQALQILSIKTPEKTTQTLANLTFVITGEVTHYKNRAELQKAIESAGGRVSSAVSAKTSYLINNDSTSTSGKNKKALSLNIPIITESEFLALLNPN